MAGARPWACQSDRTDGAARWTGRSVMGSWRMGAATAGRSRRSRRNGLRCRRGRSGAMPRAHRALASGNGRGRAAIRRRRSRAVVGRERQRPAGRGRQITAALRRRQLAAFGGRRLLAVARGGRRGALDVSRSPPVGLHRRRAVVGGGPRLAGERHVDHLPLRAGANQIQLTRTVRDQRSDDERRRGNGQGNSEDPDDAHRELLRSCGLQRVIECDHGGGTPHRDRRRSRRRRRSRCAPHPLVASEG